MRSEIYLGGVLVVNIAAIYAALIWAPTEVHLGESYRILYIHVPIAWLCYLSFGVAFVSSLLFLIRRKELFDQVAEVATVLGLIYGAVTLIAGSIWANLAWGIYWNWDPRETATLILWIAYMGYVALRASIENVEKRSVLSAIYGILAFSTVPLSYLSIVFWQTLHPQIVSSTQISITQSMLLTLFFNLATSTLFYLYIFYLLYKTRSTERRIEAYEQSSPEVKL